MGTTKTQVVKYIRKGDKGDPGANALDIAVNPSVILHKKTAASGAIYIIAVSVTDGNEKIPYKDGSKDGFQCTKFLETLPDGVKWNWTASGYYFYHFLFFDADTSANIQLSFTITYKGINHTRTVVIKTVKDGDKGDKGEQGATLRGPQAWADCSVGYVFQAGGEDESWKDVVLYNNNYYSCVKSHAKTASNYPGSAADVTNKYWQLGDKIELVATKILLTTYALVKNLGVEVIDMKDSNGNVIFQAKDGNVICNNGTFKNVKVGGVITANLFYGPTLSVTSASSRTYTIDPVNAPYNCYFINEPTNTRFIVLPKAADYDGLEIQVFTKVTNWNVDKMTFIQAQSSDNLYIKANAFQAATYGSSIKSVTVESQDAEYKNYKGTTAYMCPNAMCKFKSINGNWYAIEGIFTGE